MKQKGKNYIHMASIILVGSIIILAILRYAQAELFDLYRVISFLALAILILIFIFHGKEKINPSISTQEKSLGSWIFLCIIIQVLSFIFFISLLSPFVHYANLNSGIQSSLSNAQIWKTLDSVLFHFGLFAYGFIILFSLCLNRLTERFPKQKVTVTHFPAIKNKYVKTTIFAFFNSFRFGLFFLTASIITLFALELNNILFAHQSAALNSFVAAIAAGVFLVLTLSNPVMNVIRGLNKKSHGLCLSFALLIIVSLIIWVIASLLNMQFHARISQYKNSLITTNTLFPGNLATLFTFYAVSYWVISIPILGSLIYKLSAHKNYRQLILLNLILPLAICLSFPLWGQAAVNFLTDDFIATFVIQAILLLLLLIFANRAIARQTYWLGFLPPKKIKSHLESEHIWLFCFIIIGVYSLQAYSLFIFVLAGITIFIFISIILMLRCFLFKSPV